MSGDLAISKVLSANDTGHTGGHQAGMLISKQNVLFFPKLSAGTKNPRISLAFSDSGGKSWDFTFIYYNNKFHGGTRNEYRLTGMTQYIKQHHLEPGDQIFLFRSGEGDYSINHQQGNSPGNAEEKEEPPSEGGWKMLDLGPGAEEEGRLVSRTTNSYERSRKNRLHALALHGRGCKACGMNFKNKYGEAAEGFIEVHHVIPVSKIKPGYIINIREDLVPLCPNCHRVAHMHEPPYTVEEIRRFIKENDF